MRIHHVINPRPLQETRRKRPIAAPVSIQASNRGPTAQRGGARAGRHAPRPAAPRLQPAGGPGSRPTRYADVPAFQKQYEPAELIQKENLECRQRHSSAAS